MLRASLLLAAIMPVVAVVAEVEKTKETLFGNVAAVLTERFYDEAFREKELPRLVEIYRKRAARAANFEAECDVVQEFLSNIPATHTALIAADSFDALHHGLFGESTPSEPR